MGSETKVHNIDASFGHKTEGVESINKKLQFRVVIGALRKENCYGRNQNNFRFIRPDQNQPDKN